MKKGITLIAVLFVTSYAFSQQISDGLATQITNFNAPNNGSGAYNGYNAVGANPDKSHEGGWQHLFVVRHPNLNNNFQLQLSSSMAKNDKLYFRKLASYNLLATDSDWIELATRGSNIFTGTQGIFGNLLIENTSTKSALEIIESSDSTPEGQVAPTKSILKLSRNGTPNYSYPENAEFRIGHGGSSVFGSKLDLYINGSANTNTIPDQHVMTWNYDGNVGIGTTTPKNKLDVKGTIHSQEVKVDMLGWSDFVFKKEYNLPTLAEVEKHINEKGHLENIPNEEEVLKNGINLGEMNAKLLQKIEELTLYMIEMKKENIQMKSKQSELENTVKELNNKLK
ncbi:hypothetical protein LNQ49_22250 [Flavobacterium sp. F-65]|uniref:Cell wall anchor protein n=1 Tax=Flavobacterium pisciphilum TaxID=2893755 RepID=A0ABS8MZV1_9FLAO|nr:hypothetical protein [Flavobacterium sp. F-65]MCC9074319.1 hypothetical protein [Flavobacterium sp. F-65]